MKISENEKKLRQIHSSLTTEVVGEAEGRAEEPRLYGQASWTAEDIRTVLPDWSEEEAEEWLALAGRHIRDHMVHEGWQYIICRLEGEGYSPDIENIGRRGWW